jgi:hypothetical protein
MKRSLIVLLTVLTTAAVVTAAWADQSFEDPSGDTLGTAPDLTTLAVSNTADGNVTFRITIANYQVLPPAPGARSHLSLFFDLDRNEATGELGDEAQAHFVNIFPNRGAVNFLRWDGSAMVDVPETNMSSSFADGVLTFTISRNELLNITGFNFRALSITFVDGVGRSRLRLCAQRRIPKLRPRVSAAASSDALCDQARRHPDTPCRRANVHGALRRHTLRYRRDGRYWRRHVRRTRRHCEASSRGTVPGRSSAVRHGRSAEGEREDAPGIDDRPRCRRVRYEAIQLPHRLMA